MPICPLCDDAGLLNSDENNPEFCYCAAGKQAKRRWDASHGQKKSGVSAPSFIDIERLEEVNASVDAMRASLLGTSSSETQAQTRHPAVQLLYRVAHPGHEVSVTEATQLHDLARVLEDFFGGLAPIGRKK